MDPLSYVLMSRCFYIQKPLNHNHNGTKRRESFSEKQTLYLAIGFMIIPQKNNPLNKKKNKESHLE